MYSARSDARNATAPAMSLGRPRRPSGILRIIVASFPGLAARKGRTSGVTVMPGPTALTVMPYGPHSRARHRVSCATPPFVAQYAARLTSPNSAPIDVMFTIRPRPARRMTGATARHAHAVPRRFSSIMYSQSASACSRAGARFAVPAQFTRMSTVPWRATTASTMRSTSVFFAMSAASGTISPSRGGPPGLAAADRLTAVTRAPAAARCWTIASPMPLVPPVTMATRPERSSRFFVGDSVLTGHSSLEV
jgi:hypothetical protein